MLNSVKGWCIFAFSVMSVVSVLFSPALADPVTECSAIVEMFDTPRAVEPCTIAAENGDVQAQLFLGNAYKTPYGGFPRDIPRALKWFKSAAKQGSGEAYKEMSIIYMEGIGVLQNYKLGREFAEQAAFRGETASQHELARIYSEGIGTLVDWRQAYIWSTICVFTSGGKGLFGFYCKDMRREAERKMTPLQLQSAQDAAAKIVEITEMRPS